MAAGAEVRCRWRWFGARRKEWEPVRARRGTPDETGAPQRRPEINIFGLRTFGQKPTFTANTVLLVARSPFGVHAVRPAMFSVDHDIRRENVRVPDQPAVGVFHVVVGILFRVLHVDVPITDRVADVSAVPIIVTVHATGIRTGVVSDFPVKARKTAAYGTADALLTAIVIQVADGKIDRTGVQAARCLDVVCAITRGLLALAAEPAMTLKPNGPPRCSRRLYPRP